jgi:hypothetical protein
MEDRTHGREAEFPEPPFGSSTGDQRENDPSLPGFTDDDDLVFRSYFQHASRFTDRSYEEFRPAYRLGYDAARDPRFADRDFETAETDLEDQWLNVRLRDDQEWQTVRDFAREGFHRGRGIGFVSQDTLQGDSTESHQRPSFSDPLSGDVDPTSPESPENRARG